LFSTQVPGAPPPDVQFKEQGYLFLASAQATRWFGFGFGLGLELTLTLILP